MKKISLLLCLLLTLGQAVQAQFNFPTTPEHVFPPDNLDVGRGNETSCFQVKVDDYYSLGIQNLYTYAWSDGSNAYLAWRRDDDGNTTTFDEDFLQLSHNYRNIEVGIYRSGTQIFIVAAYYSTDPSMPIGHYYQLFEFAPGGVIPLAPQQISSSPTYGRISLDVHRMDEVAIVWRDNALNSLMIKLIGNTVLPNTQINGTANAISPDVAVKCTLPGANPLPGVRIVYFDVGLNQIIVSNSSFQQIGVTTSITFTTDDAIVPLNTPFDHTSLNIDCPVHYGLDDWSYIYTDNSPGEVRTRVRRHNSPTSFITTTYSLSQGLFGPVALGNTMNYTTGIAYGQTGRDIYYGWHYGDGNPGDPNSNPLSSGWYVAVHMNNGGTPITPEYQCIVDPTGLGPDYGWYPAPPAFSKKTETNDHLFIAYPMASSATGNFYIATKLIPWNASSFRPGGVTDVHEHETEGNELNVSVSPNPFKNQFRINAAGAVVNQLSVQLCDIQGKVITGINGSLSTVNEQLDKESNALVPGMYLLKVTSDKQNKTFKILKSN
ncbi:MAG: T9SS type A sorting domain-containing protein [Taibaiella sp.]|jgi:hypothetical protein